MPASTGRPGSGVARSDLIMLVGGGAGAKSPLRLSRRQTASRASMWRSRSSVTAAAKGRPSSSGTIQVGRPAARNSHGDRFAASRRPQARSTARARSPSSARRPGSGAAGWMKPTGRWRPVVSGREPLPASSCRALRTTSATASEFSRSSKSLKSSPDEAATRWRLRGPPPAVVARRFRRRGLRRPRRHGRRG